MRGLLRSPPTEYQRLLRLVASRFLSLIYDTLLFLFLFVEIRCAPLFLVPPQGLLPKTPSLLVSLPV